MKRCGLHWLCYVLVIIGGLNWGLVGLGYFFGGNWNVVNLLLGTWLMAENIVYLLVGVGAVLMLFDGKCKACRVGGGQTM